MTKRRATRPVVLSDADRLAHVHPRRLREALKNRAGNHCGLWGGRTSAGTICMRSVKGRNQRCSWHRKEADHV